MYREGCACECSARQGQNSLWILWSHLMWLLGIVYLFFQSSVRHNVCLEVEIENGRFLLELSTSTSLFYFPFLLSSLKKKKTQLLVYQCVVCMFVYVPHAGLVPTKTRRGHLIPQNWSYRWLWVTMWVLGSEPGYLEE